MPTDQHSHGGRRPHFHRGRRGSDRRGDRRPSSQSAPGQGAQGLTESGKADTINVDQIVREIRARIEQRHGIDLSPSQIQELAARRLEAILDPRTIKPSLLDQLRQSAATPAGIAPVEPPAAYEFEDHTIFDTHNGLLRALRNLLKPILKLFFNPNPIAHALNAQARLNKEAASRELERERTQAEWNALHYTLVQRLVTEIARTSIETQSLTLRVESLTARVDHYERRVRELELGAQPASPSNSGAGTSAFSAPRPATVGGADAGGGADQSSEGSRRRRRRRRGRRGPGSPDGMSDTSADGAQADLSDDGGADDMEPEGPSAEAAAPAPSPAAAQPAADPSPGGPPEES